MNVNRLSIGHHRWRRAVPWTAVALLSVAGLRSYVRNSWRILLKEITAFGAVGLVSLVIDLGLYNLLAPHGWLKAKFVSTIVATTFAYFGNRYLSFSHRARTSIGRETSFFFGINIIVLVLSELVLALFAYPFNQRSDHLVMNMVNLLTIALGTVFRFWAYKRFVFLHPDRVHRREADLALELAE
ncbi:MAG: GtrA family protein [Jatrophihabitans sp.]|nr:MAG: GtrA family protein [Jatrophihabitans sp.]